jgi:hypothetical protein
VVFATVGVADEAVGHGDADTLLGTACRHVDKHGGADVDKHGGADVVVVRPGDSSGADTAVSAVVGRAR